METLTFVKTFGGKSVINLAGWAEGRGENSDEAENDEN